MRLIGSSQGSFATDEVFFGDLREDCQQSEMRGEKVSQRQSLECSLRHTKILLISRPLAQYDLVSIHGNLALVEDSAAK